MKIDIKSICFSETILLIDAMKGLNNNSLQIILALDEENKLTGTLTDGDIRRGLLKGFSLNEPIKSFMNKNFTFANEGTNMKTILEVMNKKRLMRMPILNNKKEVVDIVLIEEYNNKKNPNNILIMAGGRGKRLMPFTQDCPKPMLEVDGKPILEHIIENCKSSGFENFLISVNYLKEKIINYFGDGSSWNININYLIENNPLGTAGSLYLLDKNFKDPIIVINGDVLTKLNLRKFLEFHLDQQASASIAVREDKVQLQFGVVENDGFNFVSIKEKPFINSLVNTGVYIINPSVLEFINKEEFLDMTTFLERIKNLGSKVCVYPIHEYWIDIGRPDTLNKAKKDLHESER